MMRIYGVLLFMEVMMMRRQIFMMMKNEKVLGENYGKWVQGTGPQVVVTALLRWNWAPLIKQ